MDLAVERILARPDAGLDVDDQEVLRRMADYLGRNSLRIVADNGGRGAALEVVVSNDAERLLLTLAELRALWTGLRNGAAIDWSRLRRVDARRDG